MTETVAHGKPDTLGDRIQKARGEAGITVRRLAIQLDVDPRTVARWQSDEAAPSLERLRQIADALGKPPSFFLDGVAT